MTTIASLGAVVALAARSPLHLDLTIEGVTRLYAPPLMLGQFRFWHDADGPVAVAVWAFVTESVQRRLLANGERIRPEEWRAGDRPYVVDLIAPFGHGLKAGLDMRAMFRGRSLAWLRGYADGRRKAVEFG